MVSQPRAWRADVPKWLRILIYTLAAGMGAGGAALGFSKPVTMLAILAVVFLIEGTNYVLNKGSPKSKNLTERK
jgi:hypothetical protein